MSTTAPAVRTPGYGLTVGLAVLAAILWTLVFGLHVVPFWVGMGASVGALAILSLVLDGQAILPLLRLRPSDLAWGLGSAALLYGVFFAGDRMSALLFSFAPTQVGGIYGLAGKGSHVAIGLLLGLVLGPGEEIFWRGFLQRRLMSLLGPWTGFVVASLVYGGVHIASGNFMLVMAALVAGTFWGFMYVRLGRLWPLVISHVVWDIVVFLLLPIR